MKAVFLGMATTDFIATVPHLPRADEVFELQDLQVMGGGPAATAAVAFARLGGEALFAGAVGTDATSDALVAELDAYGVATSLTQRQPDVHAPRSVILVEAGSGKRSIMYSRGTATEPQMSDGLAAAITSAGALHLDGYHIGLALAAAGLARKHGIPVSFDGGAGDRWPRLEELLPLVDWLVVARAFAERETGESDPVRAARKLDAETAVVTDGSNGAWYRAGSHEGHVPAFRVPVVDTTGAGDVFHGAFVHARLAGHDLPEAVRFASATAAIKCGSSGGRPGIPDLPAVNALLGQSA